MTVHIATAPAALAVDLELVKLHLNLFEDYQDPLLEQLYIPSAIWNFEQTTGLALIEQDILQTFDQFPCENYFLLERVSPGISDLVVKYYDEDNTLTTFAASNYIFADKAFPPSVCLGAGKAWPSDIHTSRLSAVEVTYTAGYENSAAVPADIKQAICLIVGDLFTFREDSIAVPGVLVANPTWPSMKHALRWKTQFFEHPSQSRKLDHAYYLPFERS